MAVSAPPRPPAEIDDGVIEEARRRQRRRRFIFGGAGAGALLLGLVLALALAGGRGGKPAPRGLPEPGPPLRLTFVRGIPYVNGQPFPISIRPGLGPGQVYLSVMAFPGGGGGSSYPGPHTQLWGDNAVANTSRVGPSGEIDYVLAQPDVAAIRVSGLGTVTPVSMPGLPPGVRIAVFYRPPGSPGVVVPPGFNARGIFPAHAKAVTLTPLNTQGHLLPNTPAYEGSLALPISYWENTLTVPANGRCALRSTAPGVRVQWGEVARQISRDRSVTGPAFLPCMQAWYLVPGGAFIAAVLLNAEHPGAPPAPLWGATPVPGHPGVVQVNPVGYETAPPPRNLASTLTAELTPHYGKARARQMALRFAAYQRTHRWLGLAPGVVARRDGPAWLLVEDGTLAQRLAFLDTLKITRLDLAQGR